MRRAEPPDHRATTALQPTAERLRPADPVLSDDGVETTAHDETTPDPAAGRPPEPPIIGDRYVATSLITSGRVADVWHGTDTRLGRAVRLRVLGERWRADPTAVQRFLDVATATARLDHDGLLTVLDVSPHPAVVITEDLTASSLAAHLAHGALPPAEACTIVRRASEALGAAHAAGLTHGHPATESIEIDEHGRVVITDLGLRWTTDDTNPTDDVFGLASVLVAALTGRPPKSSDIDPVHTEAVAALGASAPPALVSLIARSLAPDPVGRPPDGREFAHELSTIDLARAADPSPPAEHGFLQSERSWLLPALAVLALAIILGFLGAITRSTDVGRSILDGARGAVGLDDESASPDTSTTTSPVADDTPTPVALPEVTRPAVRPIAAVVDYDPQGDGVEHPDRLALLDNGDPSNGWGTESYATSDFGNLKDGVGLIVRLASPSRPTALELATPLGGWTLEIYLSDGAPTTLDDWGAAHSTFTTTTGTNRIDLADGDLDVASLLLWIVDLGPAEPGEHRVTISDLAILT